jgi:hypothetical protein
LLRAFANEIAAQAVAQTLSATGIPADLRVDDCGGSLPPLAMYRGFQVFVRSRDLAEATALLADFEAPKPDPDPL